MQGSISIVTVYPEQAAEWLEKYNDRNRDKQQDTVVFYASQMDKGLFCETAEVHLFNDGQRQRMINGQHTCSAIIMHGKPVRVTLRQSTGTPAECDWAYTVGHDTGKSRTFNDATKAIGLAEQMDSIPSSYLNRIAASVRFASRNFGAGHFRESPLSVSNYELMGIVPVWEAEAHAILDTITPCEKQVRASIVRSDTFSVALLTFYFQPEKAADFWSGVAKGDNLTEGDPRKTLREFLALQSFNALRKRPEQQFKVARKVAIAWNAFYLGKPAHRLRLLPDKEKALIRLEGTHYTGQQPSYMWPSRVGIVAA